MMKIGLALLTVITLASCIKDNKVVTTNSDGICNERTEVIAPEGFQIETIGTLELLNSYTEFQFVSPNIGYALGTGGKVSMLKTIDSGLTWKKLNVVSAQNPRNMAFKNENIGIITVHDVTGCPPPNCQHKCVLLKTENGGDSWKKIDLAPLRGVLYHPTFDEDGNLYATLSFDDSKTLMKSEDDGETWDTLSSSDQLDFTYSTFSYKLINDKIFASGKSGKILVINKAGNLEKVIETNEGSIWNLKIIDEQNLIVELSAKIIKSANGGDSWEILHDGSARIIDFESSNEGLIIKQKSSCPTDVYWVNDVIASTKDGGLTWNEAQTTTTNMRVQYQNSQKIADNKYFVLIKDRLLQISEK